MGQQTIAFIARATRFSPNSVGKDLAILSAVRRVLQHDGYTCADIVAEDVPQDIVEADAYVSMGRCQDTLNWLGQYERDGIPVVNCTASVMLCKMRRLQQNVLDEAGIPLPPHVGGNGYWVKRDYGYAETPYDVQYAPDHAAAQRIAGEMALRGIPDVDIRAHVVGDLLKCYAVTGTDFFRYYYPGDDGLWKFSAEQHNGRPHHYPFDADALHAMLQQAAATLCLDVYGADCIVRPDGSFVLVDLNDWPSFSRCIDEAAVPIAHRIRQEMRDE